MPVITLNYAHFRGYLEHGCNAVLINASAIRPGNLSAKIAHATADYTSALRHLIGRRKKLFDCSAKLATRYTLKKVRAS